MTNDLAQQVPAGWYADPSGATAQRWWDGAAMDRARGAGGAPVRRAGAAPADECPPARRSTPCGSGSRSSCPLRHRAAALAWSMSTELAAAERAWAARRSATPGTTLASLLGWPLYGLTVLVLLPRLRGPRAPRLRSPVPLGVVVPLAARLRRRAVRDGAPSGRPRSRVAVGRDRGDGDDLRRLGLAVRAPGGGHLQRRDGARAPGRTESIERMPRHDARGIRSAARSSARRTPKIAGRSPADSPTPSST